MNMRTLIIIPIFNEVSTIKGLLRNVLETKKENEDIVVIDDGSTDGSSEMLDRYKDIMKVTHSQNQGYGVSLIDGFNFAKENDYQLAITLDCDFQHPPELIPVLKEKIREVDILSGSRYIHGIPTSAPQDRVTINLEITELINKYTNLNITDAFCGFKVYRVSALKKLNLTEQGYGLPIQLWIQVERANLRIKEYPVKAIYCDRRRNFKNQFEDAEHRLRYYKKVLFEELRSTNKFPKQTRKVRYG